MNGRDRPLTLWQGDQLLGELRSQPPMHDSPKRSNPKHPSLTAFLIRPAGAPPCEGVWQIHTGMPGIGVQQYPVEPDVVAERDQRVGRHRPNPGPAALEPMSEEEARGVPVERQLTVRDAAGTTYLPLQIHVQETRFELEDYATVLKATPADVLVDGVAWTVLVSFASEDDAPG